MTQSAIRKAAILISTLDNASGDALLEQMNPEAAERVRNALMELDEIPSEEQTEVIADFLGRGEREQDAGVEMDPSLSRRIENEPQANRDRANNNSPFGFLQDAEPSLLAGYLEKEHPQTAAVVISHLPPEQAAQVLEQMPPDVS